MLTCSFWGNSANNNERQLERRALLLPFTKVIDKDANMPNKIKAQMSDIIIKGNRAWKSVLVDCKKTGGDLHTFLEKVGNKQFSNTFAELTTKNHLLSFLKQSIESKDLLLHRLARISAEDLMAMFNAWCEKNSTRKVQWNDLLVETAFRTVAAHYKIDEKKKWEHKGGQPRFIGALDVQGGSASNGLRLPNNELGYWGIGVKKEFSYLEGADAPDNPLEAAAAAAAGLTADQQKRKEAKETHRKLLLDAAKADKEYREKQQGGTHTRAAPSVSANAAPESSDAVANATANARPFI